MNKAVYFQAEKDDQESKFCLESEEILKNSTESLTVGDHDVKIEVKACAISNPEIELLKELKLTRKKQPVGREISGIVSEVGQMVSDFKKGDEVVTILPLDSLYSGCAKYCIAKEYQLVSKPNEVSFGSAAACIGGGVESYMALHYLAKMNAGETLLVLSGGLGSGPLIIQVAQAWGVKVMATAGGQAEREYLDTVQPALAAILEPQALTKACMDQTGGLGLDCILDNGCLSADHLGSGEGVTQLKHDIISSLAIGGRWVTSTPDLQLDPPHGRLMFLKSASLCFLFSPVWTLAPTQLGKYLHILKELMNKMATGKLKPHIRDWYPLEKAAEAYNSERTATGVAAKPGKVVVEM